MRHRKAKKMGENWHKQRTLNCMWMCGCCKCVLLPSATKTNPVFVRHGNCLALLTQRRKYLAELLLQHWCMREKKMYMHIKGSFFPWRKSTKIPIWRYGPPYPFSAPLTLLKYRPLLMFWFISRWIFEDRVHWGFGLIFKTSPSKIPQEHFLMGTMLLFVIKLMEILLFM